MNSAYPFTVLNPIIIGLVYTLNLPPNQDVEGIKDENQNV